MTIQNDVTINGEEETYLTFEQLAQTLLNAHSGLSDATGKALDLPGLIILLKDVSAAAALLTELGYKGSYYLKVSNGKQYVILRGYAGLREALKGTRYLAANAQMLKLGLGSAAIKNGARKNIITTIIIYVPLEIAEELMKESPSFSDAVAGIAVNVSIAVVATAVGAITAAALAGVATVAIPAAVVVGGAIVVGLAVTAGLNWASQALGLEDKLSAALSWTGKAAEDGLQALNRVVVDAQVTVRQKYGALERKAARGLYDFERNLLWHLSPRAWNYTYGR